MRFWVYFVAGRLCDEEVEGMNCAVVALDLLERDVQVMIQFL